MPKLFYLTPQAATPSPSPAWCTWKGRTTIAERAVAFYALREMDTMVVRMNEEFPVVMKNLAKNK